MFETPTIDLAEFSIVVRGPFGKQGEPPHVRFARIERALCDAISNLLDVPNVRVTTHHLDEGDAFCHGYFGLLWGSTDRLCTEARARINRLVKRRGEEYLGVSCVVYVGEEMVAYSEDLSSTSSKCGVLVFAERIERAVISDTIRQAVLTHQTKKKKANR